MTLWTIAGLPGSSVLGINQVRILEWVAIPFPRGSSGSKDGTCPSHQGSPGKEVVAALFVKIKSYETRVGLYSNMIAVPIKSRKSEHRKAHGEKVM